MQSHISECLDFKEHENWRKKHPTGPVTFDAWCSKCGFGLEDKSWADGLSIEGNGRRFGYVYKMILIDGEVFQSSKRIIVCSECFPCING